MPRRVLNRVARIRLEARQPRISQLLRNAARPRGIWAVLDANGKELGWIPAPPALQLDLFGEVVVAEQQAQAADLPRRYRVQRRPVQHKGDENAPS